MKEIIFLVLINLQLLQTTIVCPGGTSQHNWSHNVFVIIKGNINLKTLVNYTENNIKHSKTFMETQRKPNGKCTFER